MPLAKLPLSLLSIREYGSKDQSISGRSVRRNEKSKSFARNPPPATSPFADSPRNVITNGIDRPAIGQLLMLHRIFQSVPCSSILNRTCLEI